MIDKEELLKLLKEHLSIHVEQDHPYDPFGGADPYIRVQIFFGSDLVAEGGS